MKNLIACLMLSLSCFAAEQNYFAWGSAARIGERERMEDRTINLHPFKANIEQGLFGLFDGHGKENAADYVASNFEKFFCEDTNNLNVTPNYRSIFRKLKQALYKNEECFECYNSGTCALVGFIHKYNYSLAWLGDSRAVYVSNGQELFETMDHKINNKIEYFRLKQIGATINKDSKGFERCRSLAVSRALGNQSRHEIHAWGKNEFFYTPDVLQGMAKQGDLIIFACDGIWDVFKSEEACEFVQTMLNLPKEELESKYCAKPISKETNLPDTFVEESGDEHLKLIARALRDEAYNKGSGDNLSVQIIQFK